MYSEIGSFLWDYSSSISSPQSLLWWEKDAYQQLFFESGRNAIKALCKILNSTSKRVLLPVYTCHTVIQPFLDENWSIEFYNINTDLSIDQEDLESVSSLFKPSVVLFHSYFGFNTLIGMDSLLSVFRKRGIIIVEDITQSLFSEPNSIFADFYVASLRKFLAIPDGGVLVSCNPIDCVNVCPSDTRMVKTAIEAFDLKREYINGNQMVAKEMYLAAYSKYTEILSKNDKLKCISALALKIFKEKNIVDLIQKRKANYKYLFENIYEIGFLKPVCKLPKLGETPLYFPVYVEENRDTFRSYMTQNNIYCPIIWPKSNYIVNMRQSKYIYDKILCFPIDQRYCIDDMQYLCEVIRSYKDEVIYNG
ncbi:hypothetical protein [Blautia sp.]|jgi:dTDP-4-amino-4,6-dideoxygalactose transaminase|uniref:hypothetical protein n=1 Tax=Blautia sp. TaxID=1955243 RepID=UPI003D94C454